MGFVAPFVPAIIGGVSSFFAKRSADKAAAPTGAQQTAISGTTQLAQLLGRQGSSLIDQGTAATGQASRFLGQLVSGDRSAIQQAVAPERAAITDLFRGAERRIGAETRGGVRDLALAQASRDKAGQLSLLAPTARQAAVPQLAQLGLGQQQIGAGAISSGAGALSSLLGPLIQQQIAGNQLKQQTGGSIGSFLFDILSGFGAGKGGGGGTFSPFTPAKLSPPPAG